MKKLALLFLLAGLWACSEDVSEETTAESSILELDQTDPVNIMNFVFQAAQTGDYTGLEKLCMEQSESDKYARMICFLTDMDTSHHASFAEHFSNAYVVGQPRIDEDYCEVTFNFGPEGKEKNETMKLIMINDKWYLQSF